MQVVHKIGVVRKCGRELIRELSVNGRYGREELRSLLFFFRVSFVASFLLDVLYGVRDKSELCVQVFFKR